MRAIKFRCWDAFRKQLCGPRGFAITIREGVISGVSQRSSDGAYSEEWGSAGSPLDQDRYKLMQFTGVCDSEGREIFEGDIVKLDHWEPQLWEVCFDEGEFKFRHTSEDIYYNDIRYLKQCSIVGNVWEHPELLTPVDKPVGNP